MASSPQENMKNEKLNAMRSFQRYRMVESMYHLLNLCATLFLFWHSSLFPIVLKSFLQAYSLLIPLFNNSFCVFLLLNAVIFIVYALSKNNCCGSNSNDAYVHCFQITVPETVNIPAESSAEIETDSSDGVVVCKSEVEELSPNYEETVTAVTESTTTMTTTCCTRVSTREKVSEEKCFRRVQSESYERRVVVGRKLKRSSTCLKKEAQRRLCYVEELSKDEFNRTVEDFIAKHKKMQLEEQLGSHKTEYLAIK